MIHWMLIQKSFFWNLGKVGMLGKEPGSHKHGGISQRRVELSGFGICELLHILLLQQLAISKSGRFHQQSARKLEIGIGGSHYQSLVFLIPCFG